MTGKRHLDMKLSVRCAAKVNLYLEILGLREDGYHEIETLVHPVSLYDELGFSPISGGIELSGDDPSVSWNEENLCFKAARSVFDAVGYKGGVRIGVHKEIPAGSGLGGGSSDAAATLVALNSLFGFSLSESDLVEIGAGLGSDIPFFVVGGPAIGRGRGEILEGVEGLKRGWFVIVRPSITISTKWAYQKFNFILTEGGKGHRLNNLIEGLKEFPERKLDTLNSFERFISEEFPEIGGILIYLNNNGAVLSSLSGSGSACYGLFSEESQADKISAHFIEKGLFTKIARPVDQAIQLLRKN